MNKLISYTKKYRTLVVILLFFLLTTIMQATPAFFYANHQLQSLVFVLFLAAYIALCYFYSKRKNFSTEDKIFLITIGGVILRSFYVLFTSVYDRQHDAGTFTTLSDDLINIGHLGYVEFLCKFGRIPEFSPYEIFSYYHPPVHHILASLFIRFQLLFGVEEQLAFENIQALTCFYSSLSMPVLYACLKKLNLKESNICVAFALLTFHPGMIFMSASVNNDMLCTLLTFVCFYFALVWMQNKTLKNLLKIALALGFGMITKLNCAVMAFPLAAIFLMHLFNEFKEKRIGKAIRDYIIFGIVTATIGLSWVIRNLVKFGDMPGVPVANEESFLYIGKYSFWDVFGIPTDLQLKYPFHTIYGKDTCNSWLILFRTSIFAEVRPENITDILLAGCQIAIVLSMVLGLILFIATIIMQIREIKEGDKELGVFLLVGYISVIITFIAFIIKYPFTCSADYRYIVIGLVMNAIAYMQLTDQKRIGTKTHVIIANILTFGILFFIFLITGILTCWNQW